MRIKRIVKIIRLARKLDKSERSGNTIISVPDGIVPVVKSMAWEYSVKRASEKWETILNDMSVEEWQKAIQKASSRLERDVMNKDRREDDKS